MFLNAESRSLKRASITAERVLEIKVSTNTIERICLDVGADLESAASENWEGVMEGEAIVPQLAIVSWVAPVARNRWVSRTHLVDIPRSIVRPR